MTKNFFETDQEDIVHTQIENHLTNIFKVKSFNFNYHYALSNTLTEWQSEFDDEAYRDL